MAKLTLADVTSGYQAASAIDSNNALVEAALENTLSRNGTSPNQMAAAIDMDSNDLLNVGVTNTASLRIAGVLTGSGGILTAPLASAVNYTPTSGADKTVKQQLDGVSTMAALLSHPQGGTVYIRGFHTEGDGGGGSFYWDASKVRTNHDGITIIDPTRLVGTWDSTARTAWFLVETDTDTGCWVKLYEKSISVLWAGAKADWDGATGTPDDDAFNKVMVVLKTNGGGTMEIPYGEYYMGTTGTATSYLAISELKNVVINGNGSLLTSNTSASVIPRVFDLTDPKGIVFNDLRFFDIGFDETISWKGSQSILIRSGGSIADIGDIAVNHCSAENCVGLFYCAGSDVTRIKHITLNGLRVDNCYYMLDFSANGDDVTCVGAECYHVRRAYIAIDVKHHDIQMKITQTAAFPGQTAMCMIAGLDGSTPIKDINVKLNIAGDLTNYTSIAKIKHQTASTGRTIDSVKLDINVDLATTNLVPALKFSDQIVNGTDRGTPANGYKGIVLDGNYPGYLSTDSLFNGTSVAIFEPVRGYIELRGGAIGAFSNHLAPVLAAGWHIRIGDKDIQTHRGDLTAASLLLGPFLANQYTVVKVKIFATTDSGSFSGRSESYDEDLLFIKSNPTTSLTTINQETSVLVVTQAANVTPVYTGAVDEYVRLTFTGATFNNAASYVRVETEYLTRSGAVV